MDGHIFKAEAVVAGRKVYEVSAESGICRRTLTEIFAGRRPLDEETVDRIRRAIWGESIRKLVLEDTFVPS